jgi:hypothetical protein
MNSIFEYIKEARKRYRTDQIEIAEGYQFSQYQTLRTIDLYHNSQFTTGNKDSLGRENHSCRHQLSPIALGPADEVVAAAGAPHRRRIGASAGRHFSEAGPSTSEFPCAIYG